MVRTVLVAIVVDLSLVGFARGDDAHGILAGRIDHGKKTWPYLAQQLVTVFAIKVPGIGAHQAIGLKKACAV